MCSRKGRIISQISRMKMLFFIVFQYGLGTIMTSRGGSDTGTHLRFVRNFTADLLMVKENTHTAHAATKRSDRSRRAGCTVIRTKISPFGIIRCRRVKYGKHRLSFPKSLAGSMPWRPEQDAVVVQSSGRSVLKRNRLSKRFSLRPVMAGISQAGIGSSSKHSRRSKSFS